MAYNRPSLNEIIERKIAEVDSRLPTAVARLRRSVLNALLRSSAAVSHGLYGFIDWTSKQIIPDSAESEMLERHANWWGKYRKQATPAVGLIDVIGDGTIPEGTVWQRADEVEYIVDTQVVITGSGTVSVIASVAGTFGNAEATTPLSLTSPIAGITSTGAISTEGLNNGTDTEADDSLRARLRERVQETPHGGAKHDYVAWAKEVTGVTRSWCFPLWSGLGTVGVFVVRDDDTNFIPDTTEIAEVQSYIDSVRPVTAQVTVMAPTDVQQSMTIGINPNNSETQATITAELQDLFARESEVEDGNGSGTILISHIREAISIASGEHNHNLVSPTADLAINQGEISSLGNITWQSI